MEYNNRYFVLIPAAGTGTRIGADKPKQYLMLDKQTILEHTIGQFLSHPRIDKIVVGIYPGDVFWHMLPISQHEKIITVPGGASRTETVLNGLLYLQTLAHADDWILVHDAVRPCLHLTDIDKLITQLQNHPVGGLLASPEPNTLKKILPDNLVGETISRENIWQALTPQMFRFGKLLPAIQAAIDRNQAITDESQALELRGERPVIVEGRRDNIKITYPDDLRLAEMILNRNRSHSDF